MWSQGHADLELRDGRVARIGDDLAAAEVTVVDVSGSFVVPAFIDSHVHLSYAYGVDGRDVGARRLAAGGIAAVVDLAAPIETLADPPAGLQVLGAGPMITTLGGYPTQGWGRDGYGLPRRGPATMHEAVDMLAQAGARVIKVAVHGDPGLSPDELAAVVERAHARGLKVAAHALGDGEANLSARVGVDILAHTPLSPLSEATIALWSDRVVISTLVAFGSGAVAVDNLRRLRAAGTTVLYGTDLGNPSVCVAGVCAEEIELLLEAGLDAEAIVESATVAPARVWGLPELGALAPGHAASVLVLDQDPRESPTALASPRSVYIDGVELDPCEAGATPNNGTAMGHACVAHRSP